MSKSGPLEVIADSGVDRVRDSEKSGFAKTVRVSMSWTRAKGRESRMGMSSRKR